ncbi:hypothetical protein QC762_209070 [Podospora pseudocomata]|uniref:Uncharacterized protein n=1 Tax=Podospora pseudocomata TaxID=2093779 RepID=A0ABR0GMM3_9PEZI|nr:hypothetical protein QC762_209070 [Podospora pseudocomata]
MSRKADFKSTETQQRLLAALIASQVQNMSIDYKKIGAMVGMTASAAEHRFRGVNAQAKGLRLAYELHEEGRGPPPSEYDFTKITSNVWGRGGPRAEDLQKYFGASTEQGLQYHFRAIKQQANVLKEAVESGQDPADAFEEYLQNGGHSVRKGVSVKGGTTKAAKAATGARASPAKPAPTRKRAAAAPAPKTPHKSPTKKQKVKGEPDVTSLDDEPELVFPLDDSPALPKVLDSSEVVTSSSDVDSPEVNYDTLDEEAPKPKANSPWKKMAGQIGGPGQWSNLMTGERAKLKSKNDQVMAQHAANGNVIDLDCSSSPDNALPGLHDSASSTPTRPQYIKKQGGAQPPSTPGFKFDNIDINDGGDEDDEMEDDDEDDGAI